MKFKKFLSMTFAIAMCTSTLPLFNTTKAIHPTKEQLQEEMQSGHLYHEIIVTKKAVDQSEPIWSQINAWPEGENEYSRFRVIMKVINKLLESPLEEQFSLYFVPDAIPRCKKKSPSDSFGYDNGIFVISLKCDDEKYVKDTAIAHKQGTYQELHCNTRIYEHLLDYPHYWFFDNLIPRLKNKEIIILE